MLVPFLPGVVVASQVCHLPHCRHGLTVLVVYCTFPIAINTVVSSLGPSAFLAAGIAVFLMRQYSVEDLNSYILDELNIMTEFCQSYTRDYQGLPLCASNNAQTIRLIDEATHFSAFILPFKP